MNTQTTKQITEADVASFLHDAAVSRGLEKDLFLAASRTCRGSIEFSIYGHVFHDKGYEWISANGDTIDAVFADKCEKMPTGEKLAAKKRAEAQKLLADAEAIEAGKEVSA